MNKLFLTIACCLLSLGSPLLHAQGILPPQTTGQVQLNPAEKYVLVGESVPRSLTVTDADGNVRPLLSYKTALDVMVVGFFSPRCSYNQEHWHDLVVFYNHYKDWNVSFIAMSSNRDESLSELSDAMSKASVSYRPVRDTNGQVAVTLHATTTPEIIIIDEWGHLRYRGPLTSSDKAHVPYASQAIEAVIGHIEPVPNAEPADFVGCPIK